MGGGEGKDQGTPEGQQKDVNMKNPIRLSNFPCISTAIECDGAIRIVDGRWSKGYVNEEQLNRCLALGLLVMERRDGMRFAVKTGKGISNEKIEAPK